MKQLFSLIKASMKGNMNIFTIKTKSKSKFIKILLPLYLVIILAFTIGSYSYMIAEPLAPLHLTFILLSIFVIFTVLFIFMQGVYKSQGILFEAKDDDLLFAMPIKKSKILFSRIVKFISFEYLFCFLFLLPAIVIYIYFENPGVGFYFLALLLIITVPIIPTIASCLIGYIIEWLTSLFHNKRLYQNVFTIIYTAFILYIALNMNNFFEHIAENATSINDLITSVYYPAGLFINMIQDFKIYDLIMYLIVNIVPFILFSYLLSFNYFNIISKLKDNSTSMKKNKNVEFIINSKSQLNALVFKEIKRYFSSAIYIFNTVFGIVFFFLISVISLFKPSIVSSSVNSITENQLPVEVINQFIPMVLLAMIVVICCTVTITASSISLEGKSYNITKSLPIDGFLLIKAKVLTSLLISVPLLLISDICLFITFKIKLLYIVSILLATVLMSLLFALADIIVNLKYPKMEFSNDTEVVKQSASTLIAMFVNMAVTALFIVSAIKLMDILDMPIILLIELGICLILLVLCYIYLKKNSNKLLRSINV